LTVFVRLRAELLDSESALGKHCLASMQASSAKYSSIELAREAFASRVATALEGEAPLFERGLGGLHLDDLYLACACSEGIPSAHVHFEAQCLRPLRTFIRELDGSEARLDELKQQLRERLLVGVGGQPARIAGYLGRGSLSAWVQVAAQRLALSTLRRRAPDAREVEEALLLQLVPDPDAELVQLRLRHAADFRAAVSHALGALGTRDRLLLRLHFVEGLSLSRIARTYRVSQSTASRWFARIREDMRDEAKRRLNARLGTSSSEFHSLARLLEGQLDLSLSRVLEPSTAPAEQAER
jgi:RNA polymerase sigma-70 factor, ECF subfamily